MSEETKTSSESEEQKLAQEALNEQTSPAGETVPVAKHIALRQRAQQAELANARLEGQLTAIQQQRSTEAPPTKSPVELDRERQVAEGIEPEDMTISHETYRQQQIYDQQVANQAAESAANTAILTEQAKSTTAAKIVHDDWQEVVGAGQPFLTDGEYLDVKKAGTDYGELAYVKCKAALERAKPASKAEETKPGSETNAAPESSKSEADKVPSQAEILSDLGADDMTIGAAML